MPPSWTRPSCCPPFARALIVGEANPYSHDPDDALLPWPPQSAGARLRSLLGWTEDEYLASFWRANLVRGIRWSQAEARSEAEYLDTLANQNSFALVMLGAKVAAVFSGPPFHRMPLELWEQRGRLLRIPHPSGLCREWSRPGARERLRALMQPYRVTSCARPQEVRT